MSSADHDESTVPEISGVPALINDYRAQRDAWRARGQDLERMREEALAAADREARNIVATAQNDVRRILLKAHHDLLALSAQVRAATEDDELPRTGASGAGAAATADDPPGLRDVLVTAQQDVHGLLGEARTELDALATEGTALRGESQLRRGLSAASLVPPTDQADPSSGAPDLFPSESAPTKVRNRLGTFVVVAGILMGAVIIGGVAWLWWQQPAMSDQRPPQPMSRPVAAVPPQPPPGEADPSPAGPAEAAAADGFSINVEATRSVWVQVSADGQVVATRVFGPGETHFVTGARDVSIRAGDAGAVLIAVNGGAPGPLGGDGAVLTRRYTLDEAAAGAGAPAAPGQPLTLR